MASSLLWRNNPFLYCHLDVCFLLPLPSPPFLRDLVKPGSNPTSMFLEQSEGSFPCSLEVLVPYVSLCLPAPGSILHIASIKKKKNLLNSSSSGFRQLHWDLLSMWSLAIILNLPSFSSSPLLLSLGHRKNFLPPAKQFCPHADRSLEYLAVFSVYHSGSSTPIGFPPKGIRVDFLFPKPISFHFIN